MKNPRAWRQQSHNPYSQNRKKQKQTILGILITIWLFNIAMEHAHKKRWFSHLETSIYKGFSMAMLVITRWYSRCCSETSRGHNIKLSHPESSAALVEPKARCRRSWSVERRARRQGGGIGRTPSFSHSWYARSPDGTVWVSQVEVL